MPGSGDITALDDRFVHLHTAHSYRRLDGEELLENRAAPRLRAPTSISPNHGHRTELYPRRLLRNHSRGERAWMPSSTRWWRKQYRCNRLDQVQEGLTGATIEDEPCPAHSSRRSPSRFRLTLRSKPADSSASRPSNTGVATRASSCVVMPSAGRSRVRTRRPQQPSASQPWVGEPAEMVLEHLADVQPARNAGVENNVNRGAVPQGRACPRPASLRPDTLVAVTAAILSPIVILRRCAANAGGLADTGVGRPLHR